jgi:hypothetical protein
MGKVKELYIEIQNYAYELNLENKLGITLDDFMRLDWNIETEESDDGLVCCHRVEFSSDSPRTILSKVKNLEEGKWVYLRPGELETDNEYTELFDAIIQEKEYVKNFKDALIDLEDLLKIDIDEERL